MSRENYCRICRKPAASTSLVNNFGPVPDPATHLCAEHHAAWLESSEHDHFARKEGGFTPLPDFVRRTEAEERAAKEALARKLAEARVR